MFTSKDNQLPLKNQKKTVQRLVLSAFLPHGMSIPPVHDHKGTTACRFVEVSLKLTTNS
jgi:hypothetical protein